jgi:hypothetical protein
MVMQVAIGLGGSLLLSPTQQHGGLSFHVSGEHSNPVEMPSIFVLNFLTILSVFFLFGKANPPRLLFRINGRSVSFP